jgi:hypothetical protein
VNPARLPVVPAASKPLEVVSQTILLHGRSSIHLTRSDDGHFTLKVKDGAGYVHFDGEAARSLSADLQAQLFLDEAENRVQSGDYLDQVTPSTAEFLREDAAREAAWDEAHQDRP